MKFTPFAEIPRDQQELIALAPRPFVHVEPVILHQEGGTGQMPGVHLQVGEAHVLMTMNDLADHRAAINEALAKLLEYFPK